MNFPHRLRIGTVCKLARTFVPGEAQIVGSERAVKKQRSCRHTIPSPQAFSFYDTASVKRTVG